MLQNRSPLCPNRAQKDKSLNTVSLEVVLKIKCPNSAAAEKCYPPWMSLLSIFSDCTCSEELHQTHKANKHYLVLKKNWLPCSFIHVHEFHFLYEMVKSYVSSGPFSSIIHSRNSLKQLFPLIPTREKCGQRRRLKFSKRLELLSNHRTCSLEHRQ